MMPRLFFAALIAGAVGLHASGPQVFRATTDAVSVDVSVKQGSRPVTGLAAADFVLLDNGVSQQIRVVATSALPIDVTILLDVSFSTDGAMLAGFGQAALDVAKLLTTQDRLRLLQVSNEVHEALDFQPGGVVPRFVNLQAGGATSLYDGLAAAMLKQREGDRRQLIVAVTDGRDTLSFLDRRAVANLALRSDAVVEIALGTDGADVPARSALQDIARSTGGGLRPFNPAVSIGPVFKRILDEFRTGYVLMYSPAGVARDGRHEITVSVSRRGTYEVRARRGYGSGGDNHNQ